MPAGRVGGRPYAPAVRGLRPLVLVVVLAAACRSPPASRPAIVTRVVDGDTIDVRTRGQTWRVRLIGIDAPEVRHDGHAGECGGGAVAVYARSRLDGRRVRLAFDAALRDRYGRVLAYVYVGNELFNATLVRLGYATAEPVPPNVRFTGEILAGEREAQAARRGLWSRCDGIER